MTTIVEYVVLTGGSPSDLSEKVKQLLSLPHEQWQPQGGVSITSAARPGMREMFIQAMVRYQ